MKATLIERPNRFLVHARLDGCVIAAACRDPGRLERLLVPGAELRLRPAATPGRRTRFDVVLARQGRTWVSVVPVAANDILAEALRTSEAAGLRDARVVGREVRHGRSRFDFVLSWRGRRVWTEVKSVGLVVRGLALFPDAPSARAVRHLGELLDLARRGQPALLVFVVQRGDARAVAPFAERDPEFARALAEARRGGVALRAYACQVGPRGLRLDRPLPLRPSPGARV